MKLKSIVSALLDYRIFILVVKRRFPRIASFLKKKLMSISYVRKILIKKGIVCGAIVLQEELNDALSEREKKIYDLIK